MSTAEPSEADQLAELVARVVQRDRVAFAELYRRTAPRLYAIALRRMGRAEPAQEVLQDSFLLLWQRAATYDPARGDPFRWICGILKNRITDLRRRRQLPLTGLEEAEELRDASPGPQQLVGVRLDGQRAAAALASLPDGMRRSIELAYFEELAYPEIAAQLGVPLNTVKSWIRRALIRLRDALGEAAD